MINYKYFFINIYLAKMYWYYWTWPYLELISGQKIIFNFFFSFT